MGGAAGQEGSPGASGGGQGREGGRQQPLHHGPVSPVRRENAGRENGRTLDQHLTRMIVDFALHDDPFLDPMGNFFSLNNCFAALYAADWDD